MSPYNWSCDFFFHILPLSGAEDLTPAQQINYDNKVDWKQMILEFSGGKGT